MGTNAKLITAEVQLLLNDEVVYEKMSRAHNPYGDGQASQRIVSFLKLDASNK